MSREQVQELETLLVEYGERFGDTINYLAYPDTAARIAAVREALDTNTPIPEPPADIEL